MGSLADFRAQFPQYDDMPDAVLADRLYERHYSDLPRAEFDQRLGIAAPANAAPAPPADTSEFGGGAVDVGLAPDPQGRGGETPRAIATGLSNVGPAFRQQGAGMRQMGAETTLGKLDSHLATLGTADFYQGPLAPMMHNELAAFAMERGALPQGKVTPQEFRSALDAFATNMTPQDRAAFGDRVRAKVQGRADAAGADFRAATADMQPIDAPDGSAAYYAGNIANSVATNMPGLLASVFLRNPAPAMISIGAQSGGAAYGQGRDQGLDPAAAREYAGLTALAEGIPEALPISRLLGGMGKGFFQQATEVTVAEGLSEALTAALQAGIDKGYINPDMTWGEARKQIIDQAIMGAGSGPVMTLIARGAEGVGQTAAAGARGVGSAVGDMAAAVRPPAPKPSPGEAPGRAMQDELRQPAMVDRINENLAQRGLGPVPQILQPSQARPDQGSMFVGPDSKPADVEGVEPEVLRRLALTQDRFGKQIPIISGHRSVAENDRAKGARRSQHLSGNAIDLDVRGLSKEERLRLIETASMEGFTGIGVYDNSIHLDMGARRSWGPSFKRASVPGWAEDTVQRHLNGEIKDVSPMAPPGERVQPDMLGGEDMTDTQVAARDRVDQVQQAQPEDADPVDTFKAVAEEAAGEPAEFADAMIEEAAMRGMLGQEFTDTPDFESAFPIPRTAEARQITGFDDAERQVDARMSAKVFFRKAKTGIADTAAEAQDFMSRGRLDDAEQAIARIEKDVAKIRDAFGADIAAKFEEWAGKSLAEMQAELRFARAEAGRAAEAPQEPVAPVAQPQSQAPQVADEAGAPAVEAPKQRAARIRDWDGLWAEMAPAEREAVLLRAGFAATRGKNKGGLTTAGRRIARKAWIDVNEGERGAFIRQEMRTAADQVLADAAPPKGRPAPAADTRPAAQGKGEDVAPPAEPEAPKPAEPKPEAPTPPAPAAEKPAQPTPPAEDAAAYPVGTGTPDLAEGTPAGVFPASVIRVKSDGIVGTTKTLFREGVLPKPYETAARKERSLGREPAAGTINALLPERAPITIDWRVYSDGGQGVDAGAASDQFVAGLSEAGNVIVIPAATYDLVVHRMGAEFRLAKDDPATFVNIVKDGEVVGVVSQIEGGARADGKPYTADFLRSLPAFEDGPRAPGRNINPKVPPEPKAKRKIKDVKKPDIEEARRVTLARFDRAAQELGKRIRAKGAEGVTVEAKRPTGTTTFTFPPTEEGLERLIATRAEWAKKPAATLAMPAATAAQTTAPLKPGTGTPGVASNIPPRLGSRAIPAAKAGKVDLGDRSVEMPDNENPQRKKPIERAVIRLIGPRLYKAKVKGKARAGFYRPDQGELRVRNEQDVEVLAHEMAHWMDYHASQRRLWTRFARGGTAGSTALGQRIKAEIASLSYDPNKPQVEGFAEFIRAWMTIRPWLATNAPAATAEFERLLRTLDGGPRRDRRVSAGLRSIQEQMHRWYFQGDLARLRAKEGDGDTFKDRLGDWMANRPADLLRQRLVDRIHGAKVVEQAVTGTVGDATRSAYKQFQMINGAESMHEATLRYGTPRLAPDGSIEFSGKGLIEVLGPAMTPTKFPLLMDYFKARRGAELMAQGRENLLTEGEINAGLALGQQHPEFAQIFAEWQAFNARMLDFYVQMGLITPDQKEAFQQANADYVPFHRVIESLEDGDGAGSSTIGRRLTGGAQNVRDIAENIVQGLFHNIRGALQARAKATLYKQILAHEDGALFAARIGPDSKKVRAHVEEMAKRVAQVMAAEGLTIAKNGIIVSGDPGAAQITDIKDIEAQLTADPSLLEFWIHGQRPNTTGTIVDSAIINGERVWFEVSDELLADMLMAQKGLRAAGIPLRVGQFVRRFVSRTVTNALQFLPSNLARDTVSASIMSQHGFRPLIDSVAGMYHTLAKTQTFREFMLNGGGYGTLPQTLTGDDSTSRARRQLLMPGRPLARNPIGATVDAFDKLLMAWDSAAALFEYGSRVGEFRRARQRGKNPMEAAWHAREISTDFARRPADEVWAKLMSTVPFMNAGLQGIDRDLRALVQPSREGFDADTVQMERGPDGQWVPKATSRRNAFKRVMARGAMVAAWSALLWWLNQDEERYRGLTDDERNRYWWLFPPWMEQPIKIPKPYGLGFIFGTTPETLLDAVKTQRGGDAAKTLAWGMAHNYLFWDYPGVVQPFIEDMANTKWNGSPIVPDYLKDAPADIQFNDRTPLLYKALGETMGISPLRAQHYARSFFGYYEQMMADATEAMLWRGDEWGERPFARGPVSWATHQFRGGRVAYRTKWTEGYFDLRRRAQGARMRMRVLQRDAPQNMQRAVTAMQDEVQQTLVGLSTAFSAIDRGMADMPEAVKAVKYDPRLTADQKERQIEALYAAKNRELAKFYQAAQTALDRAEKRMEAVK